MVLTILARALHHWPDTSTTIYPCLLTFYGAFIFRAIVHGHTFILFMDGSEKHSVSHKVYLW